VTETPVVVKLATSALTSVPLGTTASMVCVASVIALIAGLVLANPSEASQS
jgi:hypothetical protein